MTLTISATTAVTWNGPICGTCGARYLGSHTCSTEDILRRVGELLALLPSGVPHSHATHVPGCFRCDLSRDEDPTRNCPCRPENGGSGVCGCINGGPKITC